MKFWIFWIVVLASIASVDALRISRSMLARGVVHSQPHRRGISLAARGITADNVQRRRIPSDEMVKMKISVVKLLCKMITATAKGDSTVFQFKDMQIEEKIMQFKIKLSVSDPDTGLLPLRYAIRSGRRDVCRVLLRHGASPLGRDRVGLILHEALISDQPGSLHLLTELLEGVPEREIHKILSDESLKLSRHSKTYWLQRGTRHTLPQQKLLQLGLSRLDALKYRIVGQTFALEQVLSEVSSYYVNTELSDKPLVMLFSGPPGHGKTETAKQLAALLSCPFHKVDCRNHAHPWEMFGSGVGFVGSESGSQLGNFMEENEAKRSIVLLDEFDHCDPETWEAFYHIFDEGVFTQKKVAARQQQGGGSTSSATKTMDCSRTIWLLTTNKFDDDIILFNDRQHDSIEAYRDGKLAFNVLYDSFDTFIRPKLRNFFKGGLTRRIDAVVPFFKFDLEEAYVVADMHIDYLREMYASPPTLERKIGRYNFAVTDYAVGELSKGYGYHQLDGASAVKRDVYKNIIKRIHMQWIQEDLLHDETIDTGNEKSNVHLSRDLRSGDQTTASSSSSIVSGGRRIGMVEKSRINPVWIHHSTRDGFHQVGAVSDQQTNQRPYFLLSDDVLGADAPPSSSTGDDDWADDEDEYDDRDGDEDEEDDDGEQGSYVDNNDNLPVDLDGNSGGSITYGASPSSPPPSDGSSDSGDNESATVATMSVIDSDTENEIIEVYDEVEGDIEQSFKKLLRVKEEGDRHYKQQQMKLNKKDEKTVHGIRDDGQHRGKGVVKSEARKQPSSPRLSIDTSSASSSSGATVAMIEERSSQEAVPHGPTPPPHTLPPSPPQNNRSRRMVVDIPRLRHVRILFDDDDSNLGSTTGTSTSGSSSGSPLAGGIGRQRRPSHLSLSDNSNYASSAHLDCSGVAAAAGGGVYFHDFFAQHNLDAKTATIKDVKKTVCAAIGLNESEVRVWLRDAHSPYPYPCPPFPHNANTHAPVDDDEGEGDSLDLDVLLKLVSERMQHQNQQHQFHSESSLSRSFDATDVLMPGLIQLQNLMDALQKGAAAAVNPSTATDTTSTTSSTGSSSADVDNTIQGYDYNPFNTGGRLLTLDITDIVEGRRLLRNMHIADIEVGRVARAMAISKVEAISDYRQLLQQQQESYNGGVYDSDSTSDHINSDTEYDDGFGGSGSGGSSNIALTDDDKDRLLDEISSIDTLELLFEVADEVPPRPPSNPYYSNNYNTQPQQLNSDNSNYLWPRDAIVESWRKTLRIGDMVDVNVSSVFPDPVPVTVVPVPTPSSSSPSSSSFSSSPWPTFPPTTPTTTSRSPAPTTTVTAATVRPEINTPVVDGVRAPAWAEGIVIRIDEKSYGSDYPNIAVRVLAPVHSNPNTMIMEMNAGSFKLLPLYSQSIDWRSALKIGDAVYVLVKKGRWVKGVIVPDSRLPVLPKLSSTDGSQLGQEVQEEEEVKGNNHGNDDNHDSDSLLVQLTIPSPGTSAATGDIEESSADTGDPVLATATKPAARPIYKRVNRYSDEISTFLLPLPRQKGPHDPLMLLSY